MASVLNIEGIQISGDVPTVMSYVCDLQHFIDKSRRTGKTYVYTFHGRPEDNDGRREIGGLLVGPNTKATFQLEAPDVDADDVQKKMFAQEWEISDIKHVNERLRESMEAEKKSAEKESSAQAQHPSQEER